MVKKKTIVDGDGIEVEGQENTAAVAGSALGEDAGELLDVVEDLDVAPVAPDRDRGNNAMWNKALDIANLRILKKRLSIFR